MPAYPTIVVPGITASYLRDDYPLPPDHIWTVLTKDYQRSALHPDDLRYEAVEPSRVQAGQIYEVAYRELVDELRYNLREREDEPVPVFPFAYDWRQPLAVTQRLLSDFIDEVIARTRLLRHYDQAGYAANPKVNLVGHSMGGLIITGYLQQKGPHHPVHKVVTLATPYQGSYEAVIKVATGTANLGTSPPSSKEREAARLTPALYHLLPSFSGAVSISPPGSLPSTSLFDPALWQPSILQTIGEFIRLHGLGHQPPVTQALSVFSEMLATAAAHRTQTDNFTLTGTGLTEKDWLCVVGVDAETRVALQIEVSGTEPGFKFHSDDRDNKWQDGQTVEQRWRTGDGTVPFAGAVPLFLKLQNLVCVTPDDFGYWEIQDRALVALSGFHGLLPAMDMIHRLIVRHLTGRLDTHGNTWGRPAPGVTKATWEPPLTLKPK